MTAPIVVGIDFSQPSLDALEMAMPIARAEGAQLVLVHVAGDADSSTRDPHHRSTADRLGGALDALGEIRARHQGQGVDISQFLTAGTAELGIASAADELGAQLIVVGSRGRSGLRHILLGSVAERVLRSTTHDVLVARGKSYPGWPGRILVGTDFSPAAEEAWKAALRLARKRASVTLCHVVNIPPMIAAYSTDRFRSRRESPMRPNLVLMRWPSAHETPESISTSPFGTAIFAASFARRPVTSTSLCLAATGGAPSGASSSAASPRRRCATSPVRSLSPAIREPAEPRATAHHRRTETSRCATALGLRDPRGPRRRYRLRRNR